MASRFSIVGLARAGLPIAAIVAFATLPGLAVLASAQAGTLGFDFMSYHQVAGRAFAGEQLYDTSVQVTGGFGLFYYPPPFILIVLPFAWVDAMVAAWIFTGLSVAMLVAGIWLMPVSRTVRWVTLLLAGLSWPVAYALKLGQVGPILLLLFALGWRWLDRPARFGVVGALGALVKIQPGIVLVWAFLTRRWTAVAVGAVVGLVASLVATLTLGGPQIWVDMFTLLYNVSDPILTPHNFTPGAAAYQAGLGEPVAIAIQATSTVLVLVAVVGSAFLIRPGASYLVAVVASQLLSPILWDHYAMLMLLPVAWLLERRQWWAVLITLATSTLGLFVGLPAALYPLALWASLIGVFAVDWLQRPPRAAQAARDVPA
ncbi:MAG TPA: glycosyltransferase family 87 protein [Patescibacteria group bacterium]|nr:glycosyltransferase family 87 protein [Patescibacteria group bacterium]